MPHALVLPPTECYAPRARVSNVVESGEPSDDVLVSRAVRGDASAAEMIYRRHAPAILRIATQLFRSSSEVDDVVQDTFVAAFASLDALTDRRALRSWLVGIVLNRAKRRHRKTSFLRALGFAPTGATATGVDHHESVAATGLAADDASLLREVSNIVEQMPHDERAVWVLRHIEGERLEDIARMCGTSLATTKRRIARADARIAAQLGEQPDDDRDDVALRASASGTVTP